MSHQELAMLTDALIESILNRLPELTIGVIGDLFLDRYLDIDARLDELSVETNRTAYQVTGVRSYPGALGTIMNNLVTLGVGRIYPIAIIGDDGEGYELRQALAAMPTISPGGILTCPERRTPTYMKPMYHQGAPLAEELNRLDIKNRTPTPAPIEKMLIELIDEAWPQFDAVIVLDQLSEANCGVITDAVRQHICRYGANEPEKFILADSRERIHEFRFVSLKPNANELYRAILPDRREQLSPDPAVDFQMRRHALSRLADRPVFCTLGSQGIYLELPHDGEGQSTLISGYPVTGPIDIVGAGDSTSAGIACAVAAGAILRQAAAFGNLIASITIQQIGTTGSATPTQVRQRWQEVRPGTALALIG